MSRFAGLGEVVLRRPLPFFLLLQAGLLFYRIDLLPVWGDEQFTLNVVARPWSEIPRALAADIHPPLYYFLTKAWVALPWPGSLLTQVRALSVVWALLSTVLIGFLWLGNSSRSGKVWFLALWSLSPALVLYSRMARSYSLQLFLSCLLLWLAVRWTKEPMRKRLTGCYTAVAALLLYTHYLPGLAIVGAVNVLLAARCLRHRRWRVLAPLAASNLLLALLYAPWLPVLRAAVTRVLTTESYSPVENAAVAAVLPLAFSFVSFTYGESISIWGLGAGLLIGPLVVWLVWRGGKSSPRWLMVVGISAAIAYGGATAWVSVPFTPARLLFLLPFYLLLLVRGKEREPRLGLAVCSAVLLVGMISLWSYSHKADFLNKGYLLPFEEMAAYLEDQSGAETALILVDRWNSDPQPFLAALGDRFSPLLIHGKKSVRRAHQRVRRDRPQRIWYLRNTHDISPDSLHKRLEAELAAAYDGRRHLFLPYSPLDRVAARLLGDNNPPTHHYQVLELRRRGGEASSEGRTVGEPVGQ